VAVRPGSDHPIDTFGSVVTLPGDMSVTAAAPRALVVGGGLAGPCVANALRRAGWDVRLFERDPAVASRGQGYRIHIAPEGDLALRACLPPHLYELAVATSGRPGSAVTLMSSDLRVLRRMEVAPSPDTDEHAAQHLSVDRLTLRQVLLAGLDGAVRFDARFVGYEILDSGAVRAHFAEGRSAEGDVLIGADGPSSRVRGQLLPQATVVDLGQWAIFGKTPLTDEVRRLTPPPSLEGFSTVLGTGGRFLPLVAHRFRTDPGEASARLCPGLAFHDTRDYVMWVLGSPAVDIGERAGELPRLGGAALRDLVVELVADWHPSLSELIRRCDPDTVTATAIRTSTPVEPWESGPVTLVGDAIHCMVPAGIGAAVALRDAGLLASRLVTAHQHGEPLVAAIHGYEEEMLVYGFEAVAASQRVGQEFAQRAG
jgi:2-polyprenyl-6-methoxyphenol hydroxylase-like FAD-dependent oxidoreductase